MSLKHFVILSILSVSFLVAHASDSNDATPQDTIWFDDGAWYVGEIADSMFNGYGKMFYPDSTVYEGDWKDGLWDGKGTVMFPDGDSYSGDFREHQFSGYGKYIYSDGAVYEGNWKDGLFNGAGTMHYADGSVYAGEWTNDRKNGIGVYFDSSTEALYEGVFSNDMYVGPIRSNSNQSYNNAKEIQSIDDFSEYSFKTPARPSSCWHSRGDSLTEQIIFWRSMPTSACQNAISQVSLWDSIRQATGLEKYRSHMMRIRAKSTP